MCKPRKRTCWASGAAGVLLALVGTAVAMLLPVGAVAGQGPAEQPERVLDLRVKQGKRSVVLQWTLDPPHPDAIYDVWRKSSADSAFTRQAAGLTYPCWRDSVMSTALSYRYGIKWEVSGADRGRSNIVDVQLARRHPFILLLPGAYQIRTGQRAKGGLLLSTGLLSLASSVGFYTGYALAHDATRESADAYRDRLSSPGSGSLAELYAEWQEAYQTEEAMRTGAFVSFGVLGAAVLYHIIDVIIFPRENRCESGFAPALSATRKRPRLVAGLLSDGGCTVRAEIDL